MCSLCDAVTKQGEMLCEGVDKRVANRSKEVICLFTALARMGILVYGIEFSETCFNFMTCNR